MSSLIPLAENWFAARQWKPFPFQREAWQAYLEGKSGVVNAPTGSGKIAHAHPAGVYPK
jgi:ATP-dependent Lhr-like helicase